MHINQGCHRSGYSQEKSLQRHRKVREFYFESREIDLSKKVCGN